MNIVLAEWLFKEQTLGTYTSRFGFNIFKKKKRFVPKYQAPLEWPVAKSE